jgi:hypothetical protein
MAQSTAIESANTLWWKVKGKSLLSPCGFIDIQIVAL